MNIFSNLMSPESLYVFLWLLGAFLIGLILGWFIWGIAIKRLKEELTDLRNKLRLSQTDVETLKSESILLDKQINSLNAEVEESTKKIKDQTGKITNLSKEIKTKTNRINNVERERGNLQSELAKIKGNLKTLESEKITFSNQIDALNNSYNDAKSESETLALKVAGLEAELNAAANTHTELETKLKNLQFDNPVLSASFDGVQAEGDLKTAITKIAVLEGMIEGYKEQLTEAESDLAECNASKAELQAAAIMFESDETLIAEIEEEIIDELDGSAEVVIETEADDEAETEMPPELDEVSKAKAAVIVALTNSIGTGSASSRDNLTKISGIGKFLSKKLNALGIYNFAQIAAFDKEMIQNVTTAIEFFPGRIERDEWVRQAKKLAGISEEEETEKVIEPQKMATNIEKVELVKETIVREKITLELEAEKESLIEVEEEVEVVIDAEVTPNVVEVEEEEIPAEKTIEAEIKKPVKKTLEEIEAEDLARNAEKIAAAKDAKKEVTEKSKKSKKAKKTKKNKEKEEVVIEGAPAISKVDAEAAKEIVKNKIGSTIPVATAEDKDDLKIISGVGPFIEEKLNNLGLFTYEQISLFDSELEDRVTDAIEFFPGRIKRDEWTKQARELFKQKKAALASTTLRGMIGNRISIASVEEKDNLKKISGVGPFIEEKMNALGIYTFKQVSEFDEEIIELVTDAIQFFPGRIERDEWVRQAGELKKGK